MQTTLTDKKNGETKEEYLNRTVWFADKYPDKIVFEFCSSDKIFLKAIKPMDEAEKYLDSLQSEDDINENGMEKEN